MKRKDKEAHQQYTKKTRNKSKVQKCTSFTQTECIMGCKIARVFIDKLSTDRSVRQSTENSNDHLTVLHPSMVQNKQTTISRAPYNYKGFAKPITNNEKANSTLADTSFNNINHVLPQPPKISSKDTFIKPGPLCYKRRLLRQRDSCNISLAIPVMRGEYSENIEPLESEINLDAILEQTEPPGTPELEEPLNLNLEYRDRQENVATQCSNTFEFIDVERNPEEKADEVRSTKPRTRIHTDQQPSCSNVSASKGNNVKTVRFDCNGLTTLITSRSTANSSGPEDSNRDNHGKHSSSSSDSESDTNENGENRGQKKRKKYVRIKANAVYIHNHFYRNP